LLFIETDDPGLCRTGLEKLVRQYSPSQVLVVCTARTADFWRERSTWELLEYQSDRPSDALRVLQTARRWAPDSTWAVITPRPVFWLARLAFSYLPGKSRFLLDEKLQGRRIHGVRRFTTSHAAAARTLVERLRAKLAFRLASSRPEEQLPGSSRPADPNEDYRPGSSCRQVLVFQTDSDENMRRTLRILREKVAPGLPLVTVVSASVENRSGPGLACIAPPREPGLREALRVLREVGGSRSEIIVAAFPGIRGSFWLKVLFLLLPADHRLVFNESADCLFLNRSTLGRLLGRARPPGAPILLLHSERSDLVAQALERLRLHFPGETVLLACPKENADSYTGKEEFLVSYTGHGIRRLISLFRLLWRHRPFRIAAFFSGRSCCRIEKLAVILWPLGKKTFFNANLDFDSLSLARLFQRRRPDSLEQIRILVATRYGIDYGVEVIRRLRLLPTLAKAEVRLIVPPDSGEHRRAISRVNCQLAVISDWTGRNLKQAAAEALPDMVVCQELEAKVGKAERGLLRFQQVKQRYLAGPGHQFRPVGLPTTILGRNPLRYWSPESSATGIPLQAYADLSAMEDGDLSRTLYGTLVAEAWKASGKSREFRTVVGLLANCSDPDDDLIRHVAQRFGWSREEARCTLRRVEDIRTAAERLVREMNRRKISYRFPKVLAEIFPEDRRKELECPGQPDGFFLNSTSGQVRLGTSTVLPLKQTEAAVLDLLVARLPKSVELKEVTEALARAVPSKAEEPAEQLAGRLAERINSAAASLNWRPQPVVRFEQGKISLNLQPFSAGRTSVFSEMLDLRQSSWTLDLGAGQGTFDYASTPSRVIALDLSFAEGRPLAAAACVIADSKQLPFRSGSFELIVCNNSLEHFEELAPALGEIERTTTPRGKLWGAVPDSASPDDRLYRYLYEGGGHVNCFSLESFLTTIQASTSFSSLCFKKLYSGLVYLRPGRMHGTQRIPLRLRLFVALIPPAALETLLKWTVFLERWLDLRFGTRLGLYGWGVLFEKVLSGSGKRPVAVELPAQMNVCCGCGVGVEDHLARAAVQPGFFKKAYNCQECGHPNLLADP